MQNVIQNLIKDTKRQIEDFKKAVKHIDECGDFDFDDFKETNRIAGTNAQESELLEMWSEARLVLPGPGHPGGVESLRQVTRDSFIAAAAEAQKLVDKMENM